MKRANHLLSAIVDPDNLRLAFWKARKGKSYAEEVQRYQADLESNVLLLHQQIMSGQVEVGDYRYFKVFDPKERQICASAFKEQVLHHALMNVCHPFFERTQVEYSFASRPGKGVHAALHAAEGFTRQYRYFLKLDVRKFFDSIHHVVLKTQLDRMFKEEKLLLIFAQIIDSYVVQPSRGVPIGNLSSQYFANHYLSSLDHFIKEKLCISAYVRYMDDMVLWHDERSVLKECQQMIEIYVEEQLSCALKPMLLNYASAGLPFVGYVLRPYNTRLSQRSRKRFVQKMRNIEHKHDSGKWTEAQCQRHALPLIAFTQHANAKAFREKIIFS
ncbi:RNA-directed DNA polymerase [Haliscomenobacter sp.]|uniref:RNA-directed DNA polymerase n=1 Tax=Haliscomenobacter sp. TaxID=2717303 RepID=UPI0033651718